MTKQAEIQHRDPQMFQGYKSPELNVRSIQKPCSNTMVNNINLLFVSVTLTNAENNTVFVFIF